MRRTVSASGSSGPRSTQLRAEPIADDTEELIELPDTQQTGSREIDDKPHGDRYGNQRKLGHDGGS